MKNMLIIKGLMLGCLTIVGFFIINILFFNNGSVNDIKQAVVNNSFKAYQTPTFNFTNVSFAKDLENKTKVYNSKGEAIDTKISAKQDGTGTKVQITDTQQFTPGKYKVEIDANGKKITQDFTWGVLAINPNKSIYAPNETANLALAVLDEKGKMVCDAEVTLTVRNPLGFTTTLKTQDKSIVVNKECNQKKYTEKPDYEAKYKLGGDGVYKLELTAKTKNGSYSIQDFMVVQSNADFDIERNIATRIFPYSQYPVVITIKANKDFSGVIKELAPSDFNITALNNVIKYTNIKNNNGVQEISWNINIKKGQIVKLGYTFKAPLVSPQFYLLGSLSLISNNKTVFQESRQWQLAIDDISYSNTILSTLGLISYWRLGELSGSVADYKGSNTGSVYGVPTYGVSGAIAGDTNTAMSWAGASPDRIDVTDTGFPTGSTARTFEGWYKTSAVTDTVLISYGTGSTNQWFTVYMTSTGQLQLDSYGSSATFGSAGTLNNGRWHYIVITYDGTNARGYIDGVAYGPISITLNTVLSNHWIGTDGTNWAKGSYDDFAIYNGALTPAQVLQHYAAGSVYNDAYSARVLTTPGLKGYWRLGESSSNIYDSSGNGNNSTVVDGSPTYSQTGAIFNDSNTAVGLTGNATEFDVPHDTSLNHGDTFSIEAWINPANLSYGSQTYYWYYGKAAAGHGWQVGVGGAAGSNPGALVAFQQWTGANFAFTPNNTVIAGQWYHVVFVKNGSTRQWYVNGALVSTSGTNYTISDTTDRVGVGALGGSGATTNSFHGKLDEVAFYNVALNSQQVASHYNAGTYAISPKSPFYDQTILNSSGLVAYWPLNEISGGFKDKTGHGHDTSSIAGNPTYLRPGGLTGYGDKSVNFVRNTDWGNIPHSTDFNIGDGPVTVEFWGRVDNVSGTKWAFGKWDNSDDGWSVGYNDLGGISVYDRNSPSAFTRVNSVETTINDDTNWHYYVFTKNGATVKLYLDGILMTNSAALGTLTNNNYSVAIGAAGNSSSNTWGGDLEKVAFYNKVLSYAEVKDHYNAGVLKYNSNYFSKVMSTGGGLIAYWRLDETSGTTSYDAAGTQDLTYSGGPTLGVTGALANNSDTAVMLNGTSQYASGVGTNLWIGNGDYSIGFYAKWTSRSEFFFVDNVNQSWNGGVDMYWDGDHIIARFLGSSVYSVTSGGANGFLADSKWHYILVTYNRSGNLTLYVDGVQNGTPVSLAGDTGQGSSPAENFYIGRRASAGTPYYMPGSIDEVTIYRKVLSPQEIKQNYYAGAPSYKQSILKTNGLSVYWRLGEASGFPQDYYGVNNATVGTATQGVAGALVSDSDTANTLNGTSGYWSVPDSAALDLGDGPFSIELWLKRVAVGAGERILVAKGDGAYALTIGSATADRIGIAKDNFNVISESTVGITDTTRWHHVVWTRNGLANHIYLDGVDVVGAVGNFPLSDTSTALFMGREPGAAQYFDGSLDEVAIYNVVLTEAQVRAHYYVGQTSGPATSFSGNMQLKGLILQ